MVLKRCLLLCACLQCVIAHLENSDVARLLRIYQYVQRYEADWEVAWLQAEQKEAEERKHEPMLTDDELGEFLTAAWCVGGLSWVALRVAHVSCVLPSCLFFGSGSQLFSRTVVSGAVWVVSAAAACLTTLFTSWHTHELSPALLNPGQSNAPSRPLPPPRYTMLMSAAKQRGKRKGPKAVRVDMDDEMMDDMGGTPTPMNAANRAHQAYPGGRDKRKRKVGKVAYVLVDCVLAAHQTHVRVLAYTHCACRRCVVHLPLPCVRLASS